MWAYRTRVDQAEGTANLKVLRQGYLCRNWRIKRSPLWLEEHRHGWGQKGDNVGQGAWDLCGHTSALTWNTGEASRGCEHSGGVTHLKWPDCVLRAYWEGWEDRSKQETSQEATAMIRGETMMVGTTAVSRSGEKWSDSVMKIIT